MKEDITNRPGEGVEIAASLVLEKLKSALGGLERVVSSRSTLPILSNILIKADKSGVELVATDLEMGVRLFVGGRVDGEGLVTIPGKPFISLVNSLHGETVEIKSAGGKVVVSCGEVSAQINGTSAEDYPELPEVSGGREIRIDSDRFKQALLAVDFAVSRDESRQILTGVQLVAEGGDLVLVATDSYRLSEVVDKGVVKDEFRVIVPARTLLEVKKFLGSGDLVLRIEESQILFEFEKGQIVSRLIEGEYPPYKQIIPGDPVVSAEVGVRDLIDTLKSAAVFSLDSGGAVKLSFAEDKPIAVFAESSQLGSFNAEVEAEVGGGSEEVSFNSRYVLEGLESMDTPRCVIGVVSKTGAVSFRPVGVEGRLYIVMPLRS